MIIPSGYAQINYRFTGTSLPESAECTLGVAISAFAGTPNEAATEIAGLWNSSQMDNLHAPSVKLTEVEVKYGPAETGPTGVWAGDIPGAASGVADSPNTAILVKKITASGGRAGRGRMYVPGAPAEKISEAGTLDTTWAPLMQGVLGDFYEDMGLAGFLPYLLHGVGSPLTSPTLITNFTLDTKVATQRRRLRK